MDARPRLHVTQRAILTEDDNGVWMGRYGGENWSVTADSEETLSSVCAKSSNPSSTTTSAPHASSPSGSRPAQGSYTEEGFEARLISQEAYEDRMIEAIETYFDQD